MILPKTLKVHLKTCFLATPRGLRLDGYIAPATRKILECVLNVFALMVLLTPVVAYGWGDEGHQIIGSIADSYLSEQARKELNTLLSGSGLAEVSNWADEVRDQPAYSWSSPYHYANVTDPEKSFLVQRDCPAQGCVVSAIAKYAGALRNPSATPAEKTEAVKFLVHFVGDIHQPLHMGRPEDRGGNEIKVQWFGKAKNLHYVWDFGFFRHQQKPWANYAGQLQAKITTEQITQWRSLDPIQWADESSRLASVHAYAIPQNRQLGEEYFQTHLPIVEHRLSQAGVRLAFLLNAIFDPDQPVVLGDWAEPFRQPQLIVGPWNAVLDSPGGELPFGLLLQREAGDWHGWLVNGQEKLALTHVGYDQGTLILEMAHYDSVIQAQAGADGSRLNGRWRKRRGPDQWAEMQFHARAGEWSRFQTDENSSPQSQPKDGSIDGRWAVQFQQDDQPAVGVFNATPSGEVTGTFLTPTGDFRYLAGRYDQGKLKLSCFDGAHAFLFHATLEEDGTLKGDFWSGAHWHDTWTAQRDQQAKLPDGFGQSQINEQVKLGDLAYRDLTGQSRSLADPDFKGHPLIVEVFGSWCPNCNDAIQYLVELDQQYRDRGLRIVGLAFELTGDFQRDARQVQKLADRYGVKFPLLLAGQSGKDQASTAFPLLDKIQAYPTTLFLTSDGQVHAVHTGFSGPATGAEYELLKFEFTKTIEELLQSQVPSSQPASAP